MLLFIAAVLAIALVLSVGPRLFCPHLLPLWESGSQAKLGFSPNQLSGYDIIVVLGKLASRSFRSSLRVPWARRNHDQELSALVNESFLTMPLRTSQKDLNAYTLAVERTTQANANWAGPKATLFLSALTEPAMLLLLAQSSCKVRPLGAVNVRNRFELLRPDLCTEPTLRSFSGAVLTASRSKHVRRVKRGFEVDLILTLDIAAGNLSGTVTVFRQIFTILQFAKTDSTVAQKAESGSVPQASEWTDAVSFNIEYEEPSAWARVCKDYNPIHISAVAAKLFGFPGKIAHGNHVAAKAFDLLERSTLPSECTALCRSDGPIWMEIEFKRPIVVPAQLQVNIAKPITQAGGHGDSMPFQILGKNKVCIEGRLGLIEDSTRLRS